MLVSRLMQRQFAVRLFWVGHQLMLKTRNYIITQLPIFKSNLCSRFSLNLFIKDSPIMIELLASPSLTPQTIQTLDIPQHQKIHLNQIVLNDHMLSYILGQSIWMFPQFDKKYCRLSPAGKYANTKPTTPCLQQMETVFHKVKHFPQVNEIVIFRHNLLLLNKSPIINIHFKNLKELYLQLNKTLSIEPLAWFDGESLEKLSISENYITCIKPLQKLRLTDLKYLNIYHNLLNSSNSQHLSRMKLSHTTPKEIYFDAEKIEYVEGKSFYFEDIGFAFKLEATEGDILRCLAEHRINQHKVRESYTRIGQ